MASFKKYIYVFNFRYRVFPIDMAGFAFHVRRLLNTNVRIAVASGKSTMRVSYWESDFLEQIASSPSTVECRGSDKEVFALL